jgi:acetyl esterase/lipase
MADPEMAAIRDMLAASPRPAGLAQRRARLDAMFAAFPVPSDVAVESVDANGVPAEWTSSPGDPSRVLLFIHGGGYSSGSLRSHRHMVAEVGRLARLRTLALDYRLAPENPFPAGLDDVLAAYHFLIGLGITADRIVMAGDSAGGGLTLAAVLALRDAGVDLPACLWCISPLTDLAQTGATMDSKAAADPMIQKPYLNELAEQYLAGTDARMPLASPLYAKLHGLPPTLIQVGAAETLLDDAVRLAALAGAADVAVTLQIWPEMIHVWPLFYPRLAAGRRTLSAAVSFIGSCLAAGSTGSATAG